VPVDATATDKIRERFGAPVSYAAVSRAYNTMRAVAGTVVAAGSLFVWVTSEAPAAPWALAAGVLVAGDGLIRWNRSGSVQVLLIIDITVVGMLLLTQGHTPSLEAAGFVYVLTAALLLLERRDAMALLGLAAAWIAPLATLAPIVDGDGAGHAILESISTAAFIAVIGQLLLSTGRALYHADRKQREALETERRAVEIKNEFVSMVSHELRTPLTSIAGFTDALRESWSRLSDSEIEEFLVIMRRETGYLRDLVEDILVIPRLETGHLRMDPESLDLRRECFQIADLVFQDSATEFDIAIPAAVRVHADPVRLRQVLRNLMENALKYGGDQVLLDGETTGSHFRVVVTDNGPGVPESDQERIFDHFEQLTKGDSRLAQGVGLGLPIARKLVRAMGGDLWYEARFPTGSRFCFTVQMTGASVPAEPTHPGTVESTRVA
jgi:signal transduction histidine kinase